MITQSSEVSKITQTIALLLVKHHKYIGKTLWLKILHALAIGHRDLNLKLPRMCLARWFALIVEGMGKKTAMVLPITGPAHYSTSLADNVPSTAILPRIIIFPFYPV